MQFIDLVNRRRSVRRYDSTRGVDRLTIDTCLEAARLAPSASNAQPWRFVVVDQPDLRARVAEKTYGPLLSFNRFAAHAPVLVVAVVEDRAVIPRLGGFLKGTRYSLIDIGIAAEHFCLQAAEQGLGTCMIGWFDEGGIRKLLGIPSRRRVALVITVGYETERPASRVRSRKSLDEIREFNGYRGA